MQKYKIIIIGDIEYKEVGKSFESDRGYIYQNNVNVVATKKEYEMDGQVYGMIDKLPDYDKMFTSTIVDHVYDEVQSMMTQVMNRPEVIKQIKDNTIL